MTVIEAARAGRDRQRAKARGRKQCTDTAQHGGTHGLNLRPWDRLEWHPTDAFGLPAILAGVLSMGQWPRIIHRMAFLGFRDAHARASLDAINWATPRARLSGPAPTAKDPGLADRVVCD